MALERFLFFLCSARSIVVEQLPLTPPQPRRPAAYDFSHRAAVGRARERTCSSPTASMAMMGHDDTAAQ